MASFFLGGLKSILVRLIVVGAILVLGYAFIAKPLIDEAQESTSGVQEVVNTVTDALGGESIGSIVDQVRSQLSGDELSRAEARRLVVCIRRAEGDRARMQRCARRFGP